MRNFLTHLNRSWLIVSLVAVLIAAGLQLRHILWQPLPVVVPPPVRTELVQRGEIEQTVLANGKLQLYRYSDVAAQISGQINEVSVMIGDEIKSGKTLIEITPALSTARLVSNRAQLARLQAELSDQRAQQDFAELQFKRQTQLKAENATREEAFESSRMSMYSAAARVEAINAQIREIEATLKENEMTRSYTTLLAPISGTVVALAARVGQTVSAPSVPLVRIADLSKLTVQARVAEMDVPLLRKGMLAYFTTPSYPGKRWSGKLRQIIPVPADGSDEDKQTFYHVLFEVNNPQLELMSGMSTQVSFVVAKVSDAVLLPLVVLDRPQPDGRYLINVLEKQGLLSPRLIKIGMRNRQMAQVLSGVEPGEQVKLEPSALTSP